MSNTAIASPQVQANPGWAPARTWWLVLALFAVVYLGSAFSVGLQDDADSTHAEAAREMFVTGDYVTLHVNGIRYLEKAPLMYWLVAGFYHAFGVNEFSTHLPVILAVLLLAILGMRWAGRAYGPRAGLYTGLFVCTTAGFYLFTRILIPEAILSLLIALSLYCFATALDDHRAWRWYAGYTCLALAVLTKGLLALVVVGGAALGYLVLSGEWRRWREFHLPTGLLLFVAVAAPWHLLAGFRNPRFFWFYFVNEHFLRFLGKRYPVDYNKLPAALYWTLHLVWLFPWSIFVPLTILRGVAEIRAPGKAAPQRTGNSSFRARTGLLCLVWAGVMLVFFAFSTNQEYYTVPAYFPILLLLAAAVADAEDETSHNRWLSAGAVLFVVVAVAAAGALVAGLWASRKLAFVADIGTVLQPDLAKETFSMAHMLELTGPSFAALRLPALLAAVGLPLGSLLALWLRRRRRHLASTLTTALTMALVLVAAHIALVRFDPYLSSRNLARTIAREFQPGDRVIIYGDQAFGSSLLFYLHPPIALVHGRSTSMWFGSTYPDAPKIFLSDSDLLRAWTSDQRIFLFVPPSQKARVESLLTAPRFAIAESSGKTIYSNRP